MPDADATIEVRRKTHGAFADVARVMCATRDVWHHEPGWSLLSDVQKVALDEIAHKVARILSGDPNYADHWHDVAGYAKLGERSCAG